MLGEATLTQVDRATLLRKHYAFQQDCFISDHEDTGSGILAYSEITPTPMWNHSAWLGGSEEQFKAFLPSSREWQNERNRRPIVYITEPDADRLAALEQHGFHKFDEEAWMVLDGSYKHAVHQDVIEVTSQALLEDFLNTFTIAFNIKEGGYAKVLSDQNSKGTVGFRHFILFHRQKPVSVGSLAMDGGFACIYNVGTPPNERSKGYGARIVEHLAAVARSAGCDTVYLQVENQSGAKRLYEKFGFITAFVRSGFHDTRWIPRTSGRTRLSSLLGYRAPEGASPKLLREGRTLGLDDLQMIRFDPGGFQSACIASWAYLFHRYTGYTSVPLRVVDALEGSTRCISAEVTLDQEIRQWIANVAAPFESNVVECSLVFANRETPKHYTQNQSALELHILEDAEKLEIVYRSDLFSKNSIRRIGAHFETILGYIANHPNARVSEIELLPPFERHQLLVEWNQSQWESCDTSVTHLFETQVERTPDATALVYAGNGSPEQMSFEQLNRRANRLADRLQRMGVRPEVFVGVCLPRSLDMIVSLLAILKAGGVCVPLDPAYPAERIQFMLEDSGAEVLLTCRSMTSAIDLPSKLQLIYLDEFNTSTEESESNPVPRTARTNAAYMIYTSGSTGKPKGVVIEHGAIADHCVDCKKVYGLNSRDRVLQFSSFNFDASFEQILPALISGATLFVRGEEVWTTPQFGDKLREFQLTVADLPTAYWHQLAEDWAANPEAIPSNSLRLIIVGGEALSPEKLDLWQSTAISGVRLINAYGPTETTITATSYEVPIRQASESRREMLPIGRPRGGRKLYVLDPRGNPAPIGVPGELHIGGPLLARGYHNRPELTSERFIPDPFSDERESRLYKTGDLVRYLEDGNLEFLGRIDDQVKIRGYRIELGEVEAVLCKHAQVREALVLARSDSNAEKRLTAYVIWEGQPPETRSLRNFIKERLPDYMVPAAFVMLERWPLMPNGKIDRQALPQPNTEVVRTLAKGPEDPLELQLQLVFERVLRRAPVEVDVNFFELGGDSLQALELLVQVEKATGKQLPLGTLYQSSTVQALASEVRNLKGSENWSSLVPLQTSGSKPPLIFLHTTPGDILGYGNLVYRLGPDQPCYGLQSLGLNDARLSHSTVPEMAAYYADLLKSFQPEGPYYLCGWCYGGIVAVEVARLLQKEGQEVAMLALLETVAVPPSLLNYRYYFHRLRSFLRMSPRRWATYFKEKARYARESRMANRLRFRQNLTDPSGEIQDPRLAKLEHVYNTNLAALNQFTSIYYNGRVTLFNAAERDPALIPDSRYGWVGLAREIEIYEVPGNHDTMLSEPNVSALARALSKCLNRPQSGPGSRHP